MNKRDEKMTDGYDRKRHHLSTWDLVSIAVLSALGGVLSTYVGYLGNMVNRFVGVPFGAGQFMAGLHIFWMVLAFGITRKKGSATAVGILKGVVELFMGSTHGVIIILVSAVQGLFLDATIFGFSLFKKEDSRIATYLGAGLGAASNVFVFQWFFFSSVPISYIIVISFLAFLSGAFFGGYFGITTLENLALSGALPGMEKPHEKKRWSSLFKPHRLIALVMALALLVGGLFYFAFVFGVPPDDASCSIAGNVEDPYTFRYADFQGSEITLKAELNGSFTHVPPKNYTGVPLKAVLEKADPGADASKVEVISYDGYKAEFTLTDILSDNRTLLEKRDGSLRLVAADYEGAFWVRQIREVKVV